MAALEEQSVIDSISEKLDRLPGNDDFQRHRKSAFEKLSLIGLPTAGSEEYKFTNITKLLQRPFRPTSATPRREDTDSVQLALDTLKVPELEVYNLVFINGYFSDELSDDVFPDAIEVLGIGQAAREKNASFMAHFGSLTNKSGDPFTQMNTALTEDGIFVKVKAGAIVDKPIAICHINRAGQEALHTNYRNLIVADTNSQVTFLELSTTDKGAEIFENTTTEIVVSENARVQYYTLQNSPETVHHLNTTEVRQHRSGLFSAFTFTLNGGIVRNNLNVSVDGEGCETNLFGLYVLSGSTHVDNHTAVDHVQPQSYSNELYKGILDDRSKGVFNGKVFVRQQAQKTNAFQSNKNILLTDSATIHAKPQLEIWADDVKCSHGCTTGRLDEDALFYLRSRGLDAMQARALLLYAFAAEVLKNIKIEPLKCYLEKIIAARLH